MNGNVLTYESLDVTVGTTRFNVGRDSSVGMASVYGLDGPGIESRWGRDFLHSSTPALGSTRCGFFRPKNPTASAGFEPAILGQHVNH
jgi:hypothetical protein